MPTWTTTETTVTWTAVDDPSVTWVVQIGGTGGGGGTFDGVHNDLSGRSTANAHPASAISGLGGAALLNVGTTTGTVAAGNDARLSDARTPTGGAGGALSGTYPDPGLNTEAVQDLVGGMAGAALSYDDTAGELNVDIGTTAGTVVAGDDARLSDARVPLSHVHAGEDITSGTVAPQRLGSGTPSAFTFLDGTGAWVADVPVFLAVRNTTASTIAKGAALVATGSVGASGAVEVGLADADDPTKMPAIGLAADAIVAGASGHAVVTGVLRGLNTTGYSINAPAFVATTAGQLTPTRPTGASELVQNIGRVVRVHGSTGEIIVLGPGRSNDIPNSIDGAAIGSGTVAAARLGSGTPSASNFLRGDGSWQTLASTGDVVGPASSVDGRVALFDGTTGKLLKQSSAAPVLEGDARLTDTRTPTDGTVTNAKVSTTAAIANSKLAGIGGASTYSSVQSYSLPGVLYTALANAIALGSGTIRYVPFLIRTGSLSVDRILCEVTTLQSGSNLRLGVYAADSSWQPTGAALIDVTASGATTGSKNVTVSPAVSLAAGRYLACVVADANVSIRAGACVPSWGTDHGGSQVTSPASAQVIGNRRVALTYPASLPDTGPAWTTVDSTATPFTAANDVLILLRGTLT